MNGLKESIKGTIQVNIQERIPQLNFDSLGYPSRVEVPISVIPKQFTGQLDTADLTNCIIN